MYLLKLISFILLGFIFAKITGLNHLDGTGWYTTLVATLLAIGLYASTYGINLKEAQQHLKIIVSAVTIGVLLKAAIIGGSLALLFHDPFFLILGVTVAQIDPLAVASLLKGNRMSAKAKTILASWASFDDPITVLLALYTPVLMMQFMGTDFGAIVTDQTNSSLIAYVGKIGLNLALAGGVLAVWLLVKRYAQKKHALRITGLSASNYTLLIVAFLVAIGHFLMLGIALIGLFLRPSKLDAIVEQAVTWALRGAAVLLGILLIGGLEIWKGIALGVAAYSAQIVVGALLTRGLPQKDRWHISFAQQNGITAIILALLFEPAHPGTVAIVAPAIVVINGLHWGMNKLVDKRLQT